MTKYDMEVKDADALQRAIDGDRRALGAAFIWCETPQNAYYWMEQYEGETPLDVEALKDIQRQCVVKVGTLAELNVKAGDVVEYAIGSAYHMTLGGKYEVVDPQGVIMDHGEWWSGSTGSHAFRVVSRATQSPKTWGEMTDAEKGALLLADHEGKVIQNWWRNEWVNTPPMWDDEFAYRIKPHEPVVGGKEMVVKPNKLGEYVTSHGGIDMATHRITFDTIDGKPDVNSVKMEEL